MPFGLILLPDAPWAGALESYSVTLGEANRLDVRLGSNAPGHVSLLHMDCSEEDARRVWRAVLDVAPERLPMRFISLAVEIIPVDNYYLRSGGLSLSLDVHGGASLLSLHKGVLAETLRSGIRTLGRVGDEFRPHVTLGFRVDLGDVCLAPPTNFSGNTFVASLALGELGSFGTFPRILDMAGAKM